MVDFYADWCEPCKWAEPVMAETLSRFPNIPLEKINIDNDPSLTKDFHVLSVPTFILFKKGEEIWRMRGFDIASKMTAQLQQAMSL